MKIDASFLFIKKCVLRLSTCVFEKREGVHRKFAFLGEVIAWSGVLYHSAKKNIRTNEFLISIFIKESVSSSLRLVILEISLPEHKEINS